MGMWNINLSNAQIAAVSALETISPLNLKRLEPIASWKPDNELLSLGVMVIPAENADVILLENRVQKMFGSIDLEQLKLGSAFHFDSDTGIWHEVISPNGQLSAASDLHGVSVWNTFSGEQILHIQPDTNDFEINSIDFAPDNVSVAYVPSSYPNPSPQAGIHITDITSERPERIFTYPSASVAKFSPDGLYIASGGSDGSVRRWDLQTGDYVEIRQPDDKSISSLDFANANLLAVTLVTVSGYSFEYWDTDKKQQLALEDSRVDSSYLKDGVSQIRLQDNNYNAYQLWSINTAKNLAFLQNVASVDDIDVKNNLAITLSADVTEVGIQLRSLDTGEILHTIREIDLTQGRFSASGKYLILWGPKGNVEIWGVYQK
jgi:WD40 repeat protein